MNSKISLSIEPNIYYTVEETAQLLRVSQNTVVKLLRSGQTQGIKLGRQWRVLGASLLNLSAAENDTEKVIVSDWLMASKNTLTELWDNEEDSVYDQF
ncbi:hypothetical protein CRENPOLYSF2_2340007 [Crenothrix polyspora]|uniref:Helix-turn-helix domain-containing protein n=1 Tax=Crenothrix polyspora TaxID=360316 RepID=A0A1R4H5Y9_9GAMM|nr:helix-turn-helix domain-containing protein [Crenothrix polyspora]SJM91688.1 hypothetical protein CRENPOLYSF2_2340007 [Crenothrix polyspora]